MSLPATLRRAVSVLEGLGSRRYEDLIADLNRELEKVESRRQGKRKAHERRAALFGEEFRWMTQGKEMVLIVRDATPGESGKWWCLSCGVVCEHNLDRDLHCEGPAVADRKLRRELGDPQARHVLGWCNFTSGDVEVP